MASLVKTDFKIAVGRRIERARVALGKEPVDVYTSLGVASGKYSQWENGWTLPRITEAIELVGALETSLDYIFRGIGAPQIRTVRESATRVDGNPSQSKDVPARSGSVSLKTVPK